LRVVLRLCRRGLPALALLLSACQSVTDTAPLLSSWGSGPLSDPGPERAAANQSPPGQQGTTRTTYVEGTGRFLGGEPSHETGAHSSREGITLNLVNVPTAEAAKSVLGDILAVSYSVDPSVNGNVTIQTPKPVSTASVMALFESALRGNNSALVVAGSGYKIVPAEQAMANARITIGRDHRSNGGGGASVRLVELKFISALEMRRVLEPISPRGGVVDADPARNTISLTGSSQEIASMLEAITVFDVDIMKGMSFAIVPVETSSPSVIADELKQVFASEEAGPMAGMVRFLPNRRLAAIMVISPQRQYLQRAESWIRRLDAQAAGSEKQFYTYKVQNRQAQELVDVIRSMFSGENGAQASERNVTPQHRESTGRSSGFRQRGNGFKSLQDASDGPSERSTEQPAESAPKAAQGSFGDDDEAAAPFKVVADGAKNTVLIEATPKEYRRILRLVQTLDVMPNQVLIEAIIAEVSLKDNMKFGVRWFFKEQSSGFKFTDSAGGALASVFPGFSYALAMSNVEATLNALNDVTDVNIVSSPSLTVMDNKTATLQIGDQVPISTQSAVSVENPDAPIVNSISYKDTGVILSITPRINESGRVLLDIEQEVSSVSATESSGIDSPTIRQRKVKTTVLVSDGQGIALGGLIQKIESKGQTKIPIVGDIPLIGSAFKRKDEDSERTELLILIKPHVMRNLEEAQEITEEFKNEFISRVMDQRDKSKAIEKAARRAFE
jgi:general secretion pathway protein D